jgi:hypothetical protein
MPDPDMNHLKARLLPALLVLCAVYQYTAEVCAADEPTWKAGVASVKITPAEPMWMAGYAARNKPAEGTAQELFAKALALEDGEGARVVIVTLDLIGITRDLRQTLEQRIEAQHNLAPHALLLNASHTHCGPELRTGKADVYRLEPEYVAQIREYVEWLQDRIVLVVGHAFKQLRPARLSYAHGRAGISMNRRLLTTDGVKNSPNPDGPVDQDVPVLRVEDEDGALAAVLFGYACHNTTLGFYQFCGDYAGYAQEYLEAAHPGTAALFMMGCGGDQNPYPRSTLELAQQHGRALANAVEAALQWQQPRPISGPLRSSLEEVTLQFATPPTGDELKELLEKGNRFERRRAEILLETLDTHGRINDEYPYPIQVVQFGGDLTLVALAGEVVVDYSLRLKKELTGPLVWIAGYSNDVFGYVPSLRVLKEGGYEGGGAMRYTTLPGPFAPSVEERIIDAVHELAKTTNPNTAP